MEGNRSDQKMLLDELSRGQDLMRQLKAHLELLSISDMYEPLARELMSSIEKALNLAKLSSLDEQEKRSASKSPQSENSTGGFKEQELREMSRKRKSLPTMTRQVQMTGEGEESSMDDGYHWRKYGQKGILGAKHPRSYYRCTHRNTYGCPATKQLQKTDNNPTLLNIIYYGDHTCHQKIHQHEQHYNRFDLEHYHEHQQLLSFQTNLRVETSKGPHSGEQGQTSSTFSFPSTSLSPSQPGIQLFSLSTIDNHITESSSPTFVSQASELKNCLSMGKNLRKSETELTEVISTATSTTNPLMIDMDSFLDPNLIFYDPNFLS
ncbi:hypothetical protein J5N97_004558 [Dioscorea zingiberensis]|uniref:WRKY domain-containing protein n=1 Tax=Dioscorea zingiberensis TaxID=325984 RepID=A0A9D5D899_9LILI|nr:hypothetical protein J5N97_004558 [Dioscorea zingiberensis]